MAKIRQEINILDHILTGTGFTVSDEKVLWDKSQYNGTLTTYLEVIATNSGATIDAIFDANTVNNVSIPGGTASYTLFRSAAKTPTRDTISTSLTFTASGGTVSIKAARIVIIQEATTLTNTATQIEIGNYNTGRTAESATILTNPKYWKYDASKWDGTKTFYAEAVYDSGSMDTVTVGIYETTDITAPSWSLNATIVSAVTTTVPTRTRVAFTPVDGRWYTIFSHNGSMDDHDIYRAGIVVVSGITQADFYFDGSDAAASDPDSAWTNETNLDDGNIATFATQNTASAGSDGTADRYVKVEGTNVSGMSDSDIISVSVSVYGKSNGSQVPDLDLRITTDGEAETLLDGGGGGADIINGGDTTAGWYGPRSLNTPSGGWTLAKLQALECRVGTGAGGAGFSGFDVAVVRVTVTYAQTPYPTKLEPQYLLANTLFAAGTSLQTFLTNWDSTEWDDGAGSTTYYFQAEAANGSTSDVTLEEADGGGTVTNSTLTNIDNAQISSAMTMPADQNLDTKATTNAGDVAAARILVAYVFAEATAPTTHGEGYEIITS